MKILVVEDEPSIVDNISYALSTEGFEAVCLSLGEDALQVLENGEIALVVLDVGLPDINGFELAKKIRKISDVPIIFVTARSDEIDRIIGLEIGGDDYIVKPFSPRELVARVKAVLRRTEQTERKEQKEKSSSKENFPFVHDTKRCCISYFGTKLDLSRYEYRLLQVLIKSPGRVYSREALMSIAWEEPDMSLERTVDTHIKTIRQKLKAVREDIDAVVTHRGIGYSLKEVW